MRKYSEEEIILSHKGRIISDRKGLKGGYCGSAPLALHRQQLSDPESWVHTSVDSWIEETMPSKDEQIYCLQAENRRLKEFVQQVADAYATGGDPEEECEMCRGDIQRSAEQALKGGE